MKKCEAQPRIYMTLLERDREKIEEGILIFILIYYFLYIYYNLYG
ncbi:hypothetical protein [Clostridium chromiireducens]|nr:hypothetical protein [Clostridium chromiireducens]